MKISVIVPAFNEEKLLAGTLRSIRAAMAAFIHRGWLTELIVCDNNSTDRTAEIARTEGAQVVFEPVNQISRSRNTGAAAATGDWLVFVDADSQPNAELFADLADTITKGSCLAGGCTLRMDGNRRAAHWLNGFWNGISRVTRWAAGSFIFCDAKVFREIGGFNQTLYASEEIDLFIRLKRLARKTGRRIVILHRHPMTTSDRKLRLYTTGELLRFTLKTVFLWRRTLRDPKECHAWYDGRR